MVGVDGRRNSYIRRRRVTRNAGATMTIEAKIMCDRCHAVAPLRMDEQGRGSACEGWGYIATAAGGSLAHFCPDCVTRALEPPIEHAEQAIQETREGMGDG